MNIWDVVYPFQAFCWVPLIFNIFAKLKRGAIVCRCCLVRHRHFGIVPEHN